MKLCNKFERSKGVIAISVFDLMTLNMCCAWLWYNFHEVCSSTTYPCLNYSVFYADTLCHAVTLTFDPLTLKVRSTSSREQSLYIIWAKWNIPRLSYWRSSTFSPCKFRGGVLLPSGSEGCVDPTSPNLASSYRVIIHTHEIYFSVWISCCVFKRGRLTVEWCFKRCQISQLFGPVWKLGEGLARSLYQLSKPYLRPNLRNNLMAVHCAAAKRGGLIKKKNKEK